MSGPLVKLALLVLMTHGLRSLGRLAGPRWGGLALGLPCTTAMALVSCGCERGLADAAGMAEASLLGLVAAVALPLIYVRALGLGWRLPWAVAAAIAGYAVVAGGLGCLPALGGAGCLGLATLAALAACRLAGRIPTAEDAAGRLEPSRARALALRTVVPTASLWIILALQDVAGPCWAGLLSPFPSLTLAVLVLTCLEAGPAEAGRLARALPVGNLSTVAFLAAFRFGCPHVGLVWGTVGSYAAALATLLATERLVRRSRPDEAAATMADRWHDAAWIRWGRVATRSAPAGWARGPGRVRRPGHREIFSPLVEPLAL